MYTAMALVALTVGNLTPSPTWLDDYRAAQAKVTVAGKPMAVFVGAGKTGWQAAIRDGFDPAVSKLLAEKFVCLYVDASTAKGKVLAEAFQVGDRGVVLSDRTGLTQAFSAAGTISRAELSRALVAYADVEIAQKTDTPKATTTTPKTATGTGTVPMAVPVHSGSVIVGPGGAVMAPPGYMPGPVMTGGGYGSGCGTGGYAGGGYGHRGSRGGHGCCFLGGFGSKFGGGGGGGCGQPAQLGFAPAMGAPVMAAPVAHHGGYGQSHGCGFGGGHGFGGGSKCGGLFGGFGGGMGHGCGSGGGWGGGFGGGMGHGFGGCK